MASISANNKRIAVNTLLLYMRMFVTLGITLFTSRVILKALGVEDYGIYNVVGGLVTAVGIIKGVVGTGGARFINIGLGRNDIEYARKSFSACLDIIILLCVIFIILAETFGLWFLNNMMTIPDNRIVAANWVFQFSILSFVATMVSGPYNSLIIAYERMSAFAYISVLEAFLKLIVAYLLFISMKDKLIFYSALMFGVTLIIRFAYSVYCKRRIKEIKYKFYGDKSFYKEMVSLTGWALLGQFGGLVKGQGLNILLNLFFNPAINASRGISYQINHAVKLFADNFYTAVRPQVTKYYAQSDWVNFYNLVFRSSKLSFYLILLVSLPIIIEAPTVIQLWLGQEPECSVEFVRFIIVISAVESMENPLRTTAMATGRVALYEIVITIVLLANIPISYILLKKGFQAITVFQVSLCLAIFNFFTRILLIKRLIDFPITRYICDVFLRSTLVGILALTFLAFVHSNIEHVILRLLIVTLLSFITTGILIFAVGLNVEERKLLKNLINKKLKR